MMHSPATAVTPERLANAKIPQRAGVAVEVWRTVECPQCKARVGKVCVSIEGIHLTRGVHAARRRLFWEREEDHR